MAVRWAIASGAFSSTATWNDGATLGIPTTGDDVYTNGFTVNMDVNATVNSLNNSARLRDVVTATMTSNNAPSPNVVFSSAGANPWLAYDRSFSTSTGWQSGANTLPAFIVYDFGLGNTRVVDGYTIYTFTSGNGQPRTWTLDGSNDNINWTQLNSQNLPSAIAAGSSFTVASIGNTNAYRYYRIRVTQTGGSTGVEIAEIDLYASGTASITSGGSFNFNTAGVTVTCTSTSASIGIGANNLITTTSTTGTVTLLVGSNVTNIGFTPINHSGACNFTLTGLNFSGGSSTNTQLITKSSSGTITINGNVIGGFGSGGNNSFGLVSTNGATIINGNVIGGTQVSSTGAYAIGQSAGTIVVNGNVTGGTGSSQNYGITFTGGTSLTVNGTVNGGTTSAGILTAGSSNTVTGNVIAGNFAGISSTSANTINVIGDVYASATANGISSTNANGVVNLTGNMYNGLGRNAIYCQNVFISNTATTLWRVDTGGGDYKFLYSADTTPNLPATTNVRSGVTFGPALSLTGTMVVPAASDTRKNVPVDNTVGTGELTSADIISGINASADPLAVRLKNALTDVTAGNIISQYKDS